MQAQVNKLVPAVWGGLVIGLLTGVPILNFINCACCAGILIGGALPVYLYRRQLGPDQRIEMGEGASLGLLAGLFGAVLATALSAGFGPFSRDFFYQMSSYTSNPEIQELLDNINPEMISRGFVLISFLTSIVIDCIFGLFGGLIGVAFWGKPKPGASPEVKKTQTIRDEDIVVEDNETADSRKSGTDSEPPDESTDSPGKEDDEKGRV